MLTARNSTWIFFIKFLQFRNNFDLILSSSYSTLNTRNLAWFFLKFYTNLILFRRSCVLHSRVYLTRISINFVLLERISFDFTVLAFRVKHSQFSFLSNFMLMCLNKFDLFFAFYSQYNLDFYQILLL